MKQQLRTMNEHKKYRGIISTTHRDSHGDTMSLEALQDMVDCVNNVNTRIRMSVDHRKDLPPNGRIENAVLVQKEDYYAVEADFCEFEKREFVEWDNTLIKESFNDKFTFKDVINEECTELSISLDPHCFKTKSDFDACTIPLQNIENNVPIKEELRKSILNDPEIIFHISGTFLFYQLLKPTIKKIGEKIADEISDQVIKQNKKILNLINQCIKEFLHRSIPKTRPANIIFDIPGNPHIELIARTRKDELIFKSLTGKRIAEVHTQIKEFSEHIEIAKIQFLLSDKGRWKFNYLYTTNGEVLGKKIAFDKRDRKFEMIEKNAPNGRVGISPGMIAKRS
ncbi:MAG: hypothetical protein LUF83_12290 [Alistipes sp.]|nr:hypothetical protein [Alistipes sp.]